MHCRHQTRQQIDDYLEPIFAGLEEPVQAFVRDVARQCDISQLEDEVLQEMLQRMEPHLIKAIIAAARYARPH